MRINYRCAIIGALIVACPLVARFDKQKFSHIAVTSPTVERLGDNLRFYTRAKYLATHYGLKYLFQPFPHSDQFALHYADAHLAPILKKQYQYHVKVKNEYDFKAQFQAAIADKRSALFTLITLGGKYGIFFSVLGVLPSLKKQFSYNHIYDAACYAWQIFQVSVNFKPNSRLVRQQLYSQQEAARVVQNLVRPYQPLHGELYPQHIQDSVSIALHIRTGADRHEPHSIMSVKYMPLDFCADMLAHLVRTKKDKNMYVTLFTDHPQPAVLADMIRLQLGQDCNRVTLHFREQNKSENHVVEDFFAMQQHEILIAPEDSGYSVCAQAIGNFKLVITPGKTHWDGHKVVASSIYIKS